MVLNIILGVLVIILACVGVTYIRKLHNEEKETEDLIESHISYVRKVNQLVDYIDKDALYKEHGALLMDGSPSSIEGFVKEVADKQEDKSDLDEKRKKKDEKRKKKDEALSCIIRFVSHKDALEPIEIGGVTFKIDRVRGSYYFGESYHVDMSLGSSSNTHRFTLMHGETNMDAYLDNEITNLDYTKYTLDELSSPEWIIKEFYSKYNEVKDKLINDDNFIKKAKCSLEEVNKEI